MKKEDYPGSCVLGLGKWTFLSSVRYAVFPVLWLAVASLKPGIWLTPFPAKCGSSRTTKGPGCFRDLANAQLEPISTQPFLNVLIASMAAYTLSRFRFQATSPEGDVLFRTLIPLNAS